MPPSIAPLWRLGVVPGIKPGTPMEQLVPRLQELQRTLEALHTFLESFVARNAEPTAEFVVNIDQLDIDFRVSGDTLSHLLFLSASAAAENLALFAGAEPAWQSMDGGAFLANAQAVPTGNPVNGVFFYVESGSLKWRNTNGNVVFPDYGTYTPTITGVTNVTATANPLGQWMRVGNVVTVSGQVDVDPTAGGALTQFGISLPIASDLTQLGHLAGADNYDNGAVITPTRVRADTVNDRAMVDYYADAGALSRTHFFFFQYRVN